MAEKSAKIFLANKSMPWSRAPLGATNIHGQ
jgi:hypothetical protein